MRRSVFISVALHLAILLWAVAVFPAGRVDSPPLMQIPVEIINPSEFTKIKAGEQDAEEEPQAKAPEEPKPQAVAEPKKPQQQQATLPPPPLAEEPVRDIKPKPEPVEKPKEAAKPDAKPEQPQKPKEATAPEPKSQPEKKKEAPKQARAEKPAPKKPAMETESRDFNADRIAALLNKIPDAEQAPSDPAERFDEAPPKPSRGQSDGTDLTMSVNEMDALRARIAQCWNPPPGGLGADAIIVKLRMRLNEDGTLVGLPTVTNSQASPFFQAAADAAVRAVAQCQPYTLPAEKYALWRDMILNFDPRQMYGG